MAKTLYFLLIFVLCAGWYGCSEKSHPAKAVPAKTGNERPAVTRRAVPKIITVNDSAASRSVDGRYYYDLDGRRYWRSKKDGKYHLFNKSMYNDPAFQP